MRARQHNAGLYHVFKGVTKVVKKHRITVFTKALAIKSVSPNSGATMVTITLAKPFKGTVEVQVQGTVTAANGVSNSVVVRRIIEWLTQPQATKRVRAAGPPLRISLHRKELRRSFNDPMTRPTASISRRSSLERQEATDARVPCVPWGQT